MSFTEAELVIPTISSEFAKQWLLFILESAGRDKYL